MSVAKSIVDLVGRTPLMEAARYAREWPARLLVKLEGQNPAGSAKDRVALSMLRDAEQRGLLAPGGVLVEPTSGNTGIGLAALAAARGYRVILTMPDTMSPERRALLRAYGAELVLTPGAGGMAAAVEKAEELGRTLPGAYLPRQFENPANPRAHYTTTGPEIWEDTDGQVTLFLAGVGTGGTLTGVGRYLKKKNPAVQIAAIEPASSPVLSGGPAGPHGLQGIGANFVPENFDRSVCDRIVSVTDEDARGAARRFARTEGLLVGISSGAALHAAGILAQEPEFRGKTLVALLPDSGERYLSTGVFEEDEA